VGINLLKLQIGLIIQNQNAFVEEKDRLAIRPSRFQHYVRSNPEGLGGKR